MAKYIVCGGRTYYDAQKLYADLDFFHNPNLWEPITCIVEGGAGGADTLARYWAKYNHVEVITVKADWNNLGKAAGSIRNQKMLDEHPDIDGVIAFPTGGPGTAHMMRIAKAAGYKVYDCVDEKERLAITLSAIRR